MASTILKNAAYRIWKDLACDNTDSIFAPGATDFMLLLFQCQSDSVVTRTSWSRDLGAKPVESHVYNLNTCPNCSLLISFVRHFEFSDNFSLKACSQTPVPGSRFPVPRSPFPVPNVTSLSRWLSDEQGLFIANNFHVFILYVASPTHFRPVTRLTPKVYFLLVFIDRFHVTSSLSKVQN